MPRFYAIGENAQVYTVSFNNTKVVKTPFTKPFTKPPVVTVTPDDSVIVFKKKVTKNDFTLKCKSKWTGEVEVQVLARE